MQYYVYGFMGHQIAVLAESQEDADKAMRDMGEDYLLDECSARGTMPLGLKVMNSYEFQDVEWRHY